MAVPALKAVIYPIKDKPRSVKRSLYDMVADAWERKVDCSAFTVERGLGVEVVGVPPEEVKILKH
jgi:hypothetical protein